MNKSVSNIDDWVFDREAQYFFFCQNESISGFELDQSQMRRIIDKVKEQTPDAVIVTDMSSAIGSRDLTKQNLWQDFGVIYAGAQKNFGTSGLTFVIVRDDVLKQVQLQQLNARIPMPLMMDWVKQSKESDYFVNTPSMMAIYMSHLVCEHMLNMGGMDYYEELANSKSKALYHCLDSYKNDATFDQNIFLSNTVEPTFRSRMNVPFNIDS